MDLSAPSTLRSKHGVVHIRHAEYADTAIRLPRVRCCLTAQCFIQVRRPATAETPWVTSQTDHAGDQQRLPIHFRYLAHRPDRRLPARRGPALGPRAGFGSPRTPRTARIVESARAKRRATEEDHRRCAMTGNVGTRCVDDMCQINLREELLDQLLAELALHERVRSDLTRVTNVREWPARRFAQRTGQTARTCLSSSRTTCGIFSFSALSLTVMYGGFATTTW